jgi:protein required for attachment to host cells
MEKTWILIANAERARCFVRDAKDHTLTELVDFVHPHISLAGEADGGDLTGAAGKGHGRTGHAGTQFESRTETHAKERGIFARQLANFLNTGVVGQRYRGLVLIASSPMMGEIRPLLSSDASKLLRHCVTSDLTRYQGAELKERVDHALRLQD